MYRVAIIIQRAASCDDTNTHKHTHNAPPVLTLKTPMQLTPYETLTCPSTALSLVQNASEAATVSVPTGDPSTVDGWSRKISPVVEPHAITSPDLESTAKVDATSCPDDPSCKAVRREIRGGGGRGRGDEIRLQ